MTARAVSSGWSWGEILEPDIANTQLLTNTDSLHGAHGGYDVEFLGEEGDHDELLCDVCSYLLRDPRLTLCCGKHYCETCLEQWLEKQQSTNTCPQCRHSPFEHVLNKSVKRKVNEIQVHCLHKDDGCKWEGELGSLETHLDSGTGCDYVPIPCPNHCDSILNRVSINVHLTSECELRPYSCEYCDYSSDFRSITIHHESCEGYPVDCPRGCEKLVKRQNLATHKFECSMEEVDCPFARFGCYMTVRRKDFENHLKEEVHSHLSLFVDSFRNLKSSHDTLSTTMSELHAKQTEDRDKLEVVERRLHARMRSMREDQDNRWHLTLAGFVLLFAVLLFVIWFK